VARGLRDRDLAGVGIPWGTPSDGARNQWTGELFYRLQIRNLATTPNVQVVVDLARHPNNDLLLIGGLRARIVF